MRTLTVASALFLALPASRVVHAQDAPRWFLAGSNAQAYTMSADGSPMNAAGATLALRSIASAGSGFGTVMADAPADSFAGHTARISADIETRDVSTSASVWLRADNGTTMLAIDNGEDQGIKGTTPAMKHMEITMYIPPSATRLAFGLLLSGSGETKASNVHLTTISPAGPLAPQAQHELDSAVTLVRRASMWRDTVTWSKIEPEIRAMAAGAQTTTATYPAIRALLARLGDHHSFLMPPAPASAYRTGGAANPLMSVRTQVAGIGYLSVPGYAGSDPVAAQSFVRTAYDSLTRVASSGGGTCRWIVDLRANGGGNMWPMLGALHPFLGDATLGSFVSGTDVEPWHANGEVNVPIPAPLAPLESANVAVLTSARTASSGEAVTISFIGRPRARSFGMPTAGLSTANSTLMLPDGAMMLLTTAVEADRTGKQYGHAIEPDETIPPGTSGSVADPQLARAIAWLTSQLCA